MGNPRRKSRQRSTKIKTMKTDLETLQELLQKPLNKGGNLTPEGYFADLLTNPKYTEQISDQPTTIQIKEFKNIKECGNYLHEKFIEMNMVGYNNPNSPNNLQPLEPTTIETKNQNAGLWAWISALHAHIYPIFVDQLLTPQEEKAIKNLLQIKKPQKLYRLNLCYILTQKIEEINNLNKQINQ